MKKEHPYVPLNAVEYFLSEIMVNLEEINEKLSPKVEEEKPKVTRKPRAKKVVDAE